MTARIRFAALARSILPNGLIPAVALDPPATLPTGAIQQFIQTAAPSGWVRMDGSIGNAASGATTRANADTSALFAVLWDNVAQADAPVQDSAGSTVARGASAAADFAANRRIVIPDMRGEFSRGLDAGRGVDTGRVNGSAQAHAIQAHTHTYNDAMNGSGTGNVGTGTQGTTGSTSGSTGGTETRPRNRAWTYYVKL